MFDISKVRMRVVLIFQWFFQTRSFKSHFWFKNFSTLEAFVLTLVSRLYFKSYKYKHMYTMIPIGVSFKDMFESKFGNQFNSKVGKLLTVYARLSNPILKTLHQNSSFFLSNLSSVVFEYSSGQKWGKVIFFWSRIKIIKNNELIFCFCESLLILSFIVVFFSTSIGFDSP